MNSELLKPSTPDEQQDSSSEREVTPAVPETPAADLTPTDTPAEEPFDEPSAEPAEKPADAAAEETAEETAEKPTGESAGDPIEKPAEPSAEKPADEMPGSKMPGEPDPSAPTPETGSDSAATRKNRRARRRAIWQNRSRKIIVIAGILLCVAIVITGICLYIAKQQDMLEVTFYHLRSDEVSSSFRVVQLSDLHLKEFGEDNDELVEWVERLHPDIIAITGDMNNHYDDDTHIVTDLCRRLVDIADVYYVMGNHEWVDHIHRKTSIKADIEATGVTMLENSYVEVEINDNKVVIGGLVNEVQNYEKYSGPKFMERFMEEDGFKLLLVHYPEYFFGTLNDYTIDLALCGHTHGGVVRLPLFGGIYASDQGFLPELYEGKQTVEGGTVVVVSRGLGSDSKFPRINNNPEIVVVDVCWY